MQTEEDIGSYKAGVIGICEKLDISTGSGSTAVGESKQEALVGIPSLQLQHSGLSHLLLHLICSFCTLKLNSKK